MNDDEPGGAAAWRTAVELGAQGRAAAARTALAALAVDPRAAPAIVSLSYSTRASLLRQAGGHGMARAGDGRACVLAADGRTGGPTADEWMVAAWLDALIGLAADNLGLGDFSTARRLLDRAQDCPVVPPRAALRLAWVRTEWGLYSGDLDTAQSAAAVADDRSRDLASPRHQLKTGLIAAAVHGACGRFDAARAGARQAFVQADTLGLLPLRWAAATLLAGLGEESFAAEVTVTRDLLAARGMPLVPLRPGERLASIR
ncbi:hypothetical protein GOHSU_12_00100 [Gordonia hirsuta DSM 44140 = NBRC 16056]|uniref:Uncharacterized protein n=1 Tax=Gordonia hirsuta DSM 44140 = NBRC 16056 TaxID=1121927 RepID=L7L649_9ACTN|nr:hypothetical protein [Gordonia hirsuta]GAC56620.1 hypothetical protein GOHSU_12_00100 [Gordonia hirsuta DSM 44140 = NBRC 16056]